MTTKNGTKKNMILHMLACKRAMRECIQNGGLGKEMQKVAKSYGFKLATHV